MLSQPYFALLLGLFAFSLWPQTKGELESSASHHPNSAARSADSQSFPTWAIAVGLACMLMGEALRWPDIALHIHGGLWVLSVALRSLSREKNSSGERLSRWLMSFAVGLAALGSMGLLNWLTSH